MINRIEKKILIGIVIVASLVAVATTIVVTKKNQVESGVTVISEGANGSQINTTIDSNESSVKDSSAIAFSKETALETENKVENNNKDSDKKKDINPKHNSATVPGKGVITSITWEDLYKLDYKTGKAPDSLKRLHKTKVKIPGFIVPLSDDLSALKDFLLVPNAQACIHVPPPPPNLIVYVILDKAIPIEKVSNPSWVEGTLLIEKSESEYGAASYKMLADKMVEYKF